MTTTTPTPSFATLRQKIAWETAQRKARAVRYATDLNTAHAAGVAAVAAMTPTPMIVEGKEGRYFVESGVCGFARVEVRPRTSGFARWLHKSGWRSSDYHKCVYLNISDYGQSMERKEAYAAAFAAHLTACGYEGVSYTATID